MRLARIAVASPLAVTFVLAAVCASLGASSVAHACDVAGPPNIRAYAAVENQNNVDTDTVIVVSTGERLFTPFAKLTAHIETPGGALVPSSRNDIDAGVGLSQEGTLRSVLRPTTALAPNTNYVLIVENAFTKNEAGERTAGRVQLPFHTGQGPRIVPQPTLVETGMPSVSSTEPAATTLCCEDTLTDCGPSPGACTSSVLLARQLRSVSWDSAVQANWTATLTVESTRVADEAGWTQAAGRRTKPVGAATASTIPLAIGERACVTVTLRDDATGDEATSPPLCLDGPTQLPVAASSCVALRALATDPRSGCKPTPQLKAAIETCDRTGESPPPPTGASGAGGASSPNAGPAPTEEGGCSLGGAVGDREHHRAMTLAGLCLGAIARSIRRRGTPRSKPSR